MFTAKTIVKAQFIKARAEVAALDEDTVLFEDSCNDYELPACIFYRRELRRRANRIYAAQPVINHNDYLTRESVTVADTIDTENLDWLEALLAE